MRNNTTFFERLMQLAESKGIKNVQKLSEYLDYKSPEKLYRLERDKEAKPSFSVLQDIINKFNTADLNWLISGLETTKQQAPVSTLEKDSENYTTDKQYETIIDKLNNLYDLVDSKFDSVEDNLKTIELLYKVEDDLKKRRNS